MFIDSCISESKETHKKRLLFVCRTQEKKVQLSFSFVPEPIEISFLPEAAIDGQSVTLAVIDVFLSVIEVVQTVANAAEESKKKN